MSDDETTYSKATAWPAEGARVGLITCEICGASILLDPRESISRPDQHAEWHARTGSY